MYKKILSFILILTFLIGLSPNIEVYASGVTTGSGKKRGDIQGQAGYAGGEYGFAGIIGAYRILAVDKGANVIESLGTTDYFSVDPIEGISELNKGEVTLVSNITELPSYYSLNSWSYIVPMWSDSNAKIPIHTGIPNAKYEDVEYNESSVTGAIKDITGGTLDFNSFASGLNGVSNDKLVKLLKALGKGDASEENLNNYYIVLDTVTIIIDNKVRKLLLTLGAIYGSDTLNLSGIFSNSVTSAYGDTLFNELITPGGTPPGAKYYKWSETSGYYDNNKKVYVILNDTEGRGTKYGKDGKLYSSGLDTFNYYGYTVYSSAFTSPPLPKGVEVVQPIAVKITGDIGKPIKRNDVKYFSGIYVRDYTKEDEDKFLDGNTLVSYKNSEENDKAMLRISPTHSGESQTQAEDEWKTTKVKDKPEEHTRYTFQPGIFVGTNAFNREVVYLANAGSDFSLAFTDDLRNDTDFKDQLKVAIDNLNKLNAYITKIESLANREEIFTKNPNTINGDLKIIHEKISKLNKEFKFSTPGGVKSEDALGKEINLLNKLYKDTLNIPANIGKTPNKEKLETIIDRCRACIRLKKRLGLISEYFGKENAQLRWKSKELKSISSSGTLGSSYALTGYEDMIRDTYITNTNNRLKVNETDITDNTSKIIVKHNYNKINSDKEILYVNIANYIKDSTLWLDNFIDRGSKKSVVRRNNEYSVPFVFGYKNKLVRTALHYLDISILDESKLETIQYDEYTADDSKEVPIRSGYKYVTIPKKYEDLGHEVVKELKQRLESLISVKEVDKEIAKFIKEKQKEYPGMEDLISYRDITAGVLNVGATPYTGDPAALKGFDIVGVKVIIKNDKRIGQVKLPSYMLNKYFDSVIQTTSVLDEKGLIWCNLVTDYTRSIKKVLAYPDSELNESAGTEAEVRRTHKGSSDSHVTTMGKDWNIEYKDISKGSTFIHDKKDKLGYYFPIATSILIPKEDGGGIMWSSREKLEDWYNENTLHFKQPPFIADYAFNLVRGVVNDKRAVSGITYSEYSKGIKNDKNDLLLIEDKFGVVPVYSTIKPSPKRNPNAIAKRTVDNFHFTSRYRGGSQTGAKEGEMKQTAPVYEKEIKYREVKGKNNTIIIQSYIVSRLVEDSCWYYSSFTPTQIVAYNTGSEFKYTLVGSILKYTTVKIDTGINTYLKDKKQKGILEYARSSEQNKLTKGKEYRYSVAKYNGNKLHFHPEVNMIYKIGGTTYDNDPYSLVTTIGEEKRSVDSSSLYLYKLNKTGEIKGTTYSDAALGGTSSLGTSKLTVPSGADVHVTADTQAFTVDLYGYSLDLVDPSDKEYKNIVKSGANIIMPWGNNTNHKRDLKGHFDKWANDTLNIKNYSADFELKTGKNSISNFSATVGKIVKGSTKEDGIYSLVVANGVLQKTGSYLKMIQQIMQDYDCTEKEAEDIFNNSGIYQSIIKAIESSKDTFNNSGSADKWTNILGGNDKWYDEKVRTFVIRRYTHLGNKIKDITASDKIDFGLGNTSEMGRINRDGGNTKDASWTVSIFFNPAEQTNLESLLDLKTLYRPSKQKSRTAIQEPNKNHSVLINHVPVKNAEFTISASGTGDF